MSWIAITETAVRPLLRLSVAETEVIRDVVLGGQTDPLSGIITDLVEEIRGFVAGNPANAVGSDGTIPSRLKNAAVAVARHRYLNAFQETQSYLTEQRVKEYEDAWDLLSNKVPAGKFSIDQPETVSTSEVQQAPSPKMVKPTRNFSPDASDGI